MDIELVFKIAAIGIIVAVLNQLLIRSGREDQAMMTTLAALLLAAFAGILLQRYSPAFALLLSLGAAVWLMLRLAQPLRGVLQALVQLGQRTNAQAFSCLLRSAGILLLADYVRNVKGGVIEPHVNNNWKIVGNNWKAADHEKAVRLLREGKLSLYDNPDARNLPGNVLTTADIAAF